MGFIHLIPYGSSALTQVSVAKSSKTKALLFGSKREQSSQASGKKPDLRNAGKNAGQKRIITLACLLAAIYMYPMIFKPLFQSNPYSGEELSEEVKQAKAMIGQHRPSHMPEWTSPFAPKEK